MRLLTTLLVCLLGTAACTPVPSGQPGGNRTATYQAPARERQPLLYEDAIYDPLVKTVQLYPDDESGASQLLPAVAPLGNSQALWLHFDYLAEDYASFYAKLVHCDRNWKPSRISAMEYLPNFNEFPLIDYTVSFNTLSYPYTHYRFQLPPVQLSGNYIVYVYPSGQADSPVLSKRFMVYEETVPLQAAVTLAPGTIERRTHQQLEARFGYGRLSAVVDPNNQFSLMARQNQRWDTMKKLTPSAVWDARREVEYEPFGLANAFPAGNEFRFFDLRTVRARGQNVRRIQIDSGYVRADLEVDELRANRAYAQRPDENGLYGIANFEQTDASISSEYVATYFYLKSVPLTSPVYVVGAFNGYQRNETSKMDYRQSFGGYTGKALLKQGLYNYAYADAEGNFADTEGNFVDTDNSYELFLYYKAPTERYDRLVSYRQLYAR